MSRINKEVLAAAGLLMRSLDDVRASSLPYHRQRASDIENFIKEVGLWHEKDEHVQAMLDVVFNVRNLHKPSMKVIEEYIYLDLSKSDLGLLFNIDASRVDQLVKTFLNQCKFVSSAGKEQERRVSLTPIVLAASKQRQLYQIHVWHRIDGTTLKSQPLVLFEALKLAGKLILEMRSLNSDEVFTGELPN